jgi:hypothetical protein
MPPLAPSAKVYRASIGRDVLIGGEYPTCCAATREVTPPDQSFRARIALILKGFEAIRLCWLTLKSSRCFYRFGGLVSRCT